MIAREIKDKKANIKKSWIFADIVQLGDFGEAA